MKYRRCLLMICFATQAINGDHHTGLFLNIRNNIYIFRWMVIGPARSGTAIHIDPLGTSAWNALIFGHKKWCLIHPSAPKSLVKPRRDESGRHPDEAVTWFDTVYRRVISSSWYPEYPAIHAVQHPGEVMFVPSQWWHISF